MMRRLLCAGLVFLASATAALAQFQQRPDELGVTTGGATGAGTSRSSGPLKRTAAATAPTPMTAHPMRVLEVGIHMQKV